ncbi:DUF6443 domain-containing protein [Fulvivirga ligni]|uniref:DUF6443 domain-containing protein n=1 Tax=Fulvivirga ligni TaxID=2904246 RepID=UPI001F3F44AF|nr:DUF6443 domain-containing protein [Fulvivirga ligni]UII21159.1 DUF6443 domain-containing protein [Fulvivirga ligni]
MKINLAMFMLLSISIDVLGNMKVDTPSEALEVQGPTSTCKGSTYTYTLSGYTSGTIIWNTSGTILSGQGSTSIIVNFDYSGMGQYIDASVNGVNYHLTVNVYLLPSEVGAISGPSNVCKGTTATYSIPNFTGNIVEVIWNAPNATILSSGRTYVTLFFPNNYENGEVSALINSGPCGVLSSVRKNIIGGNYEPLPTGPIQGSPLVKRGDENLIYTIEPVSYATSYQWNLPQGMSFLSGQGTNTIEVIVSNNFSGGQINVNGRNSGCSSPSPSIKEIELESQCVVLTPSYDHNYIISRDYILEINNANITLCDQVINKITYFDGLGRVIQNVAQAGSPDYKDLVSPIEYDNYNRINIDYLPFVSEEGTGSYKTFINKDDANYTNSTQFLFYNTLKNDPRPFSETIYETSPLNRTKKVYGAGQSWKENDSYVGYEYLLNNNDDKVIAWRLLISGLPDKNTEVEGFIDDEGHYLTGQLLKNVTTDERGHQVVAFTNKQDQTILKRVQADEVASKWADTYYIYDDLGNLRYVLPPVANERIKEGAIINENFLQDWTFYYDYDERNRMVMKHIPGSDSVFMVYDQRDRLVLTQDGKQRLHNQWLFTKYDAFNRPIATGFYTDTLSHGAIQSALKTEVGSVYDWYEVDGNETFGYTDKAFPQSVSHVDYLTITYYDDYGFTTLQEFGSNYYFDATQLDTARCILGNYSFEDAEFLHVKGQVTGTMTKVLDDTDSHWLKAVNYYDDKYRVIQTVMNNPGGNYTYIDKVSSIYNFPGWLLKTYTSHTDATGTIGLMRRYEYDHVGRLKRGFHQLNDNGSLQQEVLLAENRYNELGELIEKNLHVENGAASQSIDYRYNIRGWMESINNSNLSTLSTSDTDDTPDYFGMDLIYNNPLNGVQIND